MARLDPFWPESDSNECCWIVHYNLSDSQSIENIYCAIKLSTREWSTKWIEKEP